MQHDVYEIDNWTSFTELKNYVHGNNLSRPKVLYKSGKVCLDFDTEEQFNISLGVWNDTQRKEVLEFVDKFSIEELVFGKDKTERIVSCEVDGSSLELFIEDENGEVRSEFRPNKYWLLSSGKLNHTSIPLDGDLFYKFKTEFDTYEEFLNAKAFHNFGIYDPREAAMVTQGFTYFKGMKVSDVSTLSFDIESTTLEHNKDSKVLLIANTFRKNGQVIRKMFCHNDYASDKEFFDAWCAWVREVNPTLLVGHNIVIFDIPYINYCAQRAGTELNLGRNGSVIKFAEKESKIRKDGSQFYTYKKIFVYGREVIDTFFLALKYDIGRKYESYKLKQIIKQEGLEVANRQFYDADQIRFKYHIPEEWEKIKKYAEHDGDDALALFDLMVPSFFYLSQSIPKPFQQIIESNSGGQINALLIRSYLQEGHSIPKASPVKEFEGALSFGVPGIYHNVLKVDVASLYPSIILTYNIYDKFKDPNEHFLRIAKYFTKERLKNKSLAKETGDRYYKDLEQSQKVVINSFYGFLGTEGLNFNSPFNAAFITRKGREVLEKSIDWAKKNNFTIPNGDTDSISITNGKEFSLEDQKAVLDNLNAIFPDTIRFEHDGLYRNVVIVKAKNYVLEEMNGKKKIKGSALKATMKEKALQEFIKEITDLLLNEQKDQVINVYHKYVKEILNLKDITRWSSKKTITEKVLNPERTNEQKVLNALNGEESYQEGDKIKVYFTVDKQLKLEEHWNNDHNADILLEKLYKTLKVFETVIDLSLYPNYKLKRNKKLLEEINVLPL